MEINKEANFSIIVNNECNLNCSYCSGLSPHDRSNDSFKALKDSLDDKPEFIRQCSITGGEPSLYCGIEQILNMVKGRFDKVVYTTNGYNIKQILPMMEGVVDHLNLSHHEDIDAPHLNSICNQANGLGIDVTLVNVVLKNNLTLANVFDAVGFVKKAGGSAITYRRDIFDNKLVFNKVAYELLEIYVPVEEGSCASCKSVSFLIGGIKVTFKSSLLRPSDVHKEVFELIVHPDGRTYTDWKGEKLYSKYSGYSISKNSNTCGSGC
jgi:molybdenum cofactor biosynthesis enzyme MoaA